VTIATVLGGVTMFIYTFLLIAINRRLLPPPLRIRGVRLAVLVWSILMLGATSAIVAVNEIGKLV
jgi:vacuolar-type H+-ATPase subunit I/STV1